LFVAEGTRAVEELLGSSLKVRGALISDVPGENARRSAIVERLRASSIELLDVSQKDFESAAETETPQGILAIAEVPRSSLGDLKVMAGHPIVILDAVQDPGNVGTIIRTAAALGASAAVAMPGTVDPWNAKVVRGAMGANFHLPVISATWEELDAFKAAAGIAVWGTDASGIPLGDVPRAGPLALILGNEGAGLSDHARRRADALVSLPIASTIESLNVAVTAGIFLYQLRT
jgi:TrmH family RNA methyltransferase